MIYYQHWLDLYQKQLKFYERLLRQPESYWSTFNQVILEKETLRLRYFPSKDKRVTTPILILPPQAGHHSNITDYSPEQSLVRIFQNQGFDVYVTQWLDPKETYENLGIEDYIGFTNEAVDEILADTGEKSLHLVGQCQGGWQAAIYTSLFPEKISSLVVAAAPINFEAEKGPLNDIVDRLPLGFYEFLVTSGFGLLRGNYMLMGFKYLDPYQHYYKKYIDLWNLIWSQNEAGLERFDRFENWYELIQNLPGKFYLEVVENIFKKNGMINKETLKLKGKFVDLENIECPLILMAGEKDNITPPEQCLDMKNHVSTPEEDIMEVTTRGGHIGTLMGRTSLKYYWTAVSEKLMKVS